MALSFNIFPINEAMQSLSNNTGLLLLCEVLAQPFHELYSAVSTRWSVFRDLIFHPGLLCGCRMQGESKDVKVPFQPVAPAPNRNL